MDRYTAYYYGPQINLTQLDKLAHRLWLESRPLTKEESKIYADALDERFEFEEKVF